MTSFNRNLSLMGTTKACIWSISKLIWKGREWFNHNLTNTCFGNNRMSHPPSGDNACFALFQMRNVVGLSLKRIRRALLWSLRLVPRRFAWDFSVCSHKSHICPACRHPSNAIIIYIIRLFFPNEPSPLIMYCYQPINCAWILINICSMCSVELNVTILYSLIMLSACQQLIWLL